MSCRNCANDYAEDGVEPECWRGECVIPELDALGSRIIELRTMLVRLKDMVDPRTILRLYDADREDLELLAETEDAIREMQKGLHQQEIREEV